MRAVIQRVKCASVSVDGKIVSQIGKGLCVLVGIKTDDQLEDMDYIVKKILNLRLFEEETGEKNKPWSKSVKDLGLEVLCVSQFTLFAKTDKGNKPDFHLAMKSTSSQQFYVTFLEKMKTNHQTDKIKDGVFGAYMDVQIQNDGPVTIVVDSPSSQQSSTSSSNS